jgi:5'-3' exonuclease
MGIKDLNRFLYENCTKKSIRKIHLNYLTNKTIVIDTSIYLYKYSSEGLLMENMYLLISILKYYKIVPIFIFDGKPPPEKRDLLMRRRLEKKEAEEKYNIIKQNFDFVDGKKQAELEKLKRMFVRISDDEIKKVKSLMDSYGVTYYVAPGEADHLCAYLVKIGRAWGCISDDMDMFLYGCKYVIRNISLLKHSAILYDTNQIWEDLEMSEQLFREIMVLSGTDYNIHSQTSLKETIRWYYEYMKYRDKTDANLVDKMLGFYVWLVKNTKYITDYKALLNTCKMFSCNNCDELEKWRTVEIQYRLPNQEQIRKIMEPEGFIFCA